MASIRWANVGFLLPSKSRCSFCLSEAILISNWTIILLHVSSCAGQSQSIFAMAHFPEPSFGYRGRPLHARGSVVLKIPRITPTSWKRGLRSERSQVGEETPHQEQTHFSPASVPIWLLKNHNPKILAGLVDKSANDRRRTPRTSQKLTAFGCIFFSPNFPLFETIRI
jgi:hypothetical protein